MVCRVSLRICYGPYACLTIDCESSAISDDILAMRVTKKFKEDTNFPAGLAHMHAWALATSGGFWTDVHHDANGAATWVTVSSGAKIWVLLRHKQNDARSVMKALAVASTIPLDDDPRKLEEFFDVSSILIEPGSVL